MKLHRIICLAAVASLALASCETSAKARAATYSPGTYVGTSMGLGGPVEVRVTVDGSRIVDVAIEGEQETAAIGGEAMRRLREGIIVSQGSEVDTISGATRTSEAVKEALDAALAEARGIKNGPGLGRLDLRNVAVHGLVLRSRTLPASPGQGKARGLRRGAQAWLRSLSSAGCGLRYHCPAR